MSNKLSRHDWRVDDVSNWSSAREFVEQYHYSRGCSHTRVYCHGLYRKDHDDLFGVAIWLPPTKIAAQSVNKENWQRVLSLSRLAIHPEVPKNGASFLLGRSISIIKNHGKWKSLVTYADQYMNHTGGIYRATNWQYIGLMRGGERWETPCGRQVSKQSTKTRSTSEMISLGYIRIGRFDKHKFVMHL